MNEFLKSIKRFKFKSVFIYFYTHIFLVALIMCVVFSAYIYKTYIQNFSNNHKMTLNAFLTQSAEETDNSIKMLYETVLSLSKDPTIATSVVVPSFERIERNIETAQRLYTTAKNFDYINKIYLYESTNQMLFTSDETIEDFANSKHKNFVTKCLTDKTPYFDSTTRQSSKIISENGKLYMVCHFLPTPEKYLSTLIVEINSDRLFSGIKTTADETEYIIKIADRNDNSLFCTNADFDNKNIEQIEIISDYTNWKYIVYSPKTLDYSFGTYIKSILPFVVFVLFLGILVSFMVTASVYSPINKLVFFVEESEKNKNTDKIYIDSSDTNKTSEFASAFSRIDTILVIWEEKVLKLCSILCSSPISA